MVTNSIPKCTGYANVERTILLIGDHVYGWLLFMLHV